MKIFQIRIHSKFKAEVFEGSHLFHATDLYDTAEEAVEKAKEFVEKQAKIRYIAGWSELF